jgi:hypothetical protein
MLFLLIDKIKKYVNRASDDAHLLAIVFAFIAWISYCNYKEKFPNIAKTETFYPRHTTQHTTQQQQQQQQQHSRR